jgi:hypothetical protein
VATPSTTILEESAVASAGHRHLLSLLRILNPFRFVLIRTKRELMDRLEWVLRLSVGLCYVGHGFWGVVSKPAWIGLITPMGIPEWLAWKLLPWIGWADVLLGVLIIMKPRGVLLWKAFFWASFTPFLRPLAGMSFFEVPERAGNYGVPLAFIVLASGMSLMKPWWKGFEVIDAPVSALREGTIRGIRSILQVTIGLLLIGHGGLEAIAHKHLFLDQYGAVGLPASASFAAAVGWFEILLGVAVAFRPAAPLVWFILFWKIATELLFPIAGHPIDVFETIERWGDYGACVALLLIVHYDRLRPAAIAGSPVADSPPAP